MYMYIMYTYIYDRMYMYILFPLLHFSLTSLLPFLLYFLFSPFLLILFFLLLFLSCFTCTCTYMYHVFIFIFISLPKVERERERLLPELFRRLNDHCEFHRVSINLQPLCVHRLRVSFRNEQGEGSGVVRSFFTAVYEVSLRPFFNVSLDHTHFRLLFLKVLCRSWIIDCLIQFDLFHVREYTGPEIFCVH